MSNLKIGQEVLIKAKVVEHNKHDKAIAIKKKGGAIERLVYVDEESVVNSYLTTNQFKQALESINRLTDVSNWSIKTELYEKYGRQELLVYLERELDSEDYQLELFDVAINYENDYGIKEDFILNLHPQDQTTFLSLLLRYAKTPVEFRG